MADDGDLLQCIQHLDDDIQLAFRSRFRGINTGLVADNSFLAVGCPIILTTLTPSGLSDGACPFDDGESEPRMPTLSGRCPMALEKELETYNAHRDELLQHEGEFVVIQGDRVAGIWQTYETR